jgi:hypothetical protein
VTPKYVLSLSGSQFVVAGCSFRQPVEEALMRTGLYDDFSELVNLSFSEFSQLGGSDKGLLRIQTCTFATYFRNVLRGELQFSHKRRGAHYVVVDGNLMLEDDAPNTGRFAFKGNTDHIMARNNVVFLDNESRPIVQSYEDLDPGPDTVDAIHFLNNTFVNTTPDNYGDVISLGLWRWSRVRVNNNLFVVHPNFGLSLRKQFITAPAAAITEAENNVFPNLGSSYPYVELGGQTYTWTTWQSKSIVAGTCVLATVDAGDLEAPLYQCPSAEAAAAGAAQSGVFEDYHGDARPDAAYTWAVGAVHGG